MKTLIYRTENHKENINPTLRNSDGSIPVEKAKIDLDSKTINFRSVKYITQSLHNTKEKIVVDIYYYDKKIIENPTHNFTAYLSDRKLVITFAQNGMAIETKIIVPNEKQYYVLQESFSILPEIKGWNMVVTSRKGQSPLFFDGIAEKTA